MKAITPTNEQLQILEDLRVNRRKHRNGFPTKSSSHAEGDFSVLTIGQKISDVVTKNRRLVEICHYSKHDYFCLDCL